MSAKNKKEIPVLTDIVDESLEEEASDVDVDPDSDLVGSTIPDLETVIAELQTRLASRTYALTDELMRTAFAELEANIFRQISSQLRQQLPELIDTVIRDHLTRQEDEQE